jgi:hypothetical protein
MANRAYLLKNGEVLFEQKNTISFFWFCLLDTDSINNAAPDMLRIFDDEESEETANIKLSKKTFMRNLTQRKQYIAKKYGGQTSWNGAGDIELLYDNFVEYLDRVFDENDMLEMDVLEMANFNDMTTLIRQMNLMLLAIDTGEPTDDNPFASYDTAGLFVGWDSYYGNEFEKYSGVYADYLDEIKERRQTKAANTAKVKSDGLIRKQIYYAILSALTVVLLVIGMIFQSGFNYWAISAGSIVLYIWNRDVLMKK